jgi:hypothetical protein
MLASMLRHVSGRPGRVEQRAYTRFPVGLKTNVLAVGETRFTAPVRVELDNISAGGMRLQAPFTPDVGSELEITFTLPGEHRANEAKVEVLSAERLPQSCVVRCQFTELRMTGRLLDWILSQAFRP